MSENIYKSKYDWIFPIVVAAIFGFGASWAVTESKTEDLRNDVKTLEERDFERTSTIATMAEAQRNLAASQQAMVSQMDKMNEKLDRALRRSQER